MVIAATCAALPAAADDGQERDQILEIRSQGHTTYTIENKEVHAVYSGHVEFDYSDFNISADELDYNQADDSIEVAGSVVLMLEDGSTVRCDKITIEPKVASDPYRHGTFSGRITIDLSSKSDSENSAQESEPSDGADSEQPRLLQIVAGSGQFSFRKDVKIRSASQLSYSLEDGITITAAEDNQSYTLTTASASYSAETLQLTSSGQLGLVGSISEQKEKGKTDTSLNMASSGFTAQLAVKKGLKEGSREKLVINWFELAAVHTQFETSIQTKDGTESRSGWLSVGKLRLEPQEHGMADKGVGWHLEALNGPVSGMLRQNTGDLTISADEIAGDFDREGIREMELLGSASVQRDGVRLESSKITVSRGEEAYDISSPGLMEARLNFAQLSGREPIDISTIEGWLD